MTPLKVGINLANHLLREPRKEVIYPVYIPSKNRADTIISTGKLLRDARVKFRVLVEPQDVAKYYKHFTLDELLVMDANDMGIDYARNFAKAHATTEGAEYHWQLDDDIQKFLYRIDGKNKPTHPAHVLNLVESVTNLYTNIGGAAPMYDTFAFTVNTPIRLNKMLASVMLFRNTPAVTFRANIIDDIDISMQYLTNDYCTLLFSKALARLPTTPNDTGGMGAEARVGDKMRKRCENLVTQWGTDAFKVITKNNAPRIAPSNIWSTFTHQPILKDDHAQTI